jgi:hypothetical protein
VVKTTFEWHGDNIEQRVLRAVGRSQVAWGEQVTSKMRSVVHRLTGTLSRSLHTAKAGYTGESDESTARAGAAVANQDPGTSHGRAIVEAGSWISYALYEMRRGGSHDYVTDAVRSANGDYGETLKRAIMQEGL